MSSYRFGLMTALSCALASVGVAAQHGYGTLTNTWGAPDSNGLAFGETRVNSYAPSFASRYTAASLRSSCEAKVFGGYAKGTIDSYAMVLRNFATGYRTQAARFTVDVDFRADTQANRLRIYDQTFSAGVSAAFQLTQFLRLGRGYEPGRGFGEFWTDEYVWLNASAAYQFLPQDAGLTAQIAANVQPDLRLLFSIGVPHTGTATDGFDTTRCTPTSSART